MQQERPRDGNPKTVRILVAANDGNTRSALKCLAGQYSGISIEAEASNSAELPGQISRTKPDILLIDWALSGDHLPEIFSGITAETPSMIIVALGSRLESKQEALEAGADYFILKTEPPEHFINMMVQAVGCCRSGSKTLRKRITAQFYVI